MIMDEGLREIIDIFFAEAKQSIEEMEAMILEISSSKDSSLYRALFRVAHNLKGGSKTLGFSKIGKITHEIETIVLKLAEGDLDLTDQLVKIFMKTIDMLHYLLNQAVVTGEDSLEGSDVLETLKSWHQKPPSKAIEELGVKQADVKFVQLEKGIFEISTSTSEKPGFETVSLESVGSETFSRQETAANAPKDTIRVNIDRIDRLQNHVAKILVLEGVLTEQLKDSSNLLIRSTLSLMSKVFKEIQSDALGLRLVTLKNLGAKLKRSIQDAALELGKTVDFVFQGEHLEVDKMVVEKLSDPLVHLVRNAVDHGIESLADRKALGKSIFGKITLSVVVQGSALSLTLRDDGGGIDVVKLRKKGLEKGFLLENQNIDDNQILDLIFRPGFSTLDHVTQISGRGVGLDVVKTNIESISGNVSVCSQPHLGTIFTVTVPLSLSTLEAMVVYLGAEKWVIPLHVIADTLEKGNTIRDKVTCSDKTVEFKGQQFELINLKEALLIDSCYSRDARDHEKVLVVCSDNLTNLAFEVDFVVGVQTIVTKPSGSDAIAREWITGCAILGDGKTAPILDVFRLHRCHTSLRKVS